MSDYDFGDVTVHPHAPPRADPAAASSSFDPLNSTLAFGKAALKGAAEPFTGGIPNEDKKSPVMNWIEGKDPNHPLADQYGRIAGQVAPLALLPDLDFPALAARGGAAAARAAAPLAQKMYQGANFVPRIAPSKVPGMMMSGLDRLANWGWKGAVGGATQSRGDPARSAQTGAEWGIGSAALRKAAMMSGINPRYAIPLGLAALAAGWFDRGRLSPWLALHAAEAIPAGIAVGGAVLPSGVAGAAGERAAQFMNPKETDDGPQNHP